MTAGAIFCSDALPPPSSFTVAGACAITADTLSCVARAYIESTKTVPTTATTAKSKPATTKYAIVRRTRRDANTVYSSRNV